MRDDSKIDNVLSILKLEDKKKALDKLTLLEKLGFPYASFGIGVLYERGGSGVEKNYTQALYWFSRSADHEHNPNGAYAVGKYYFYGKGSEVDYSKAQQYLQIAHDAGVAPAQVLLGKMYTEGLGVKKDPEKAREFFVIAASTGNVFAIKNLACFEMSHGNIVKGVWLYVKGVVMHLFFILQNEKDIRLRW